MKDLPILDFPSLLAIAYDSPESAVVCHCGVSNLRAWASVPLSLEETELQDVGSLFVDPYDEPTFKEFHPGGTRYESPDAPIAPRYYPYNRCVVARCVNCDRHFLRYTEAGGYFVDRRIRLLSSSLIVDAPLPGE